MSLRATPGHPVTLLSSRIDREITAGERRFLEAHLQACGTCQRMESELLATSELLAGLPVGAPPPGALDRLLVRLRDSKERRTLVTQPPPQASAQSRAEPPAATETPSYEPSWKLLTPVVLVVAAVGVMLGWNRLTQPPATAESRPNPQVTESTPPRIPPVVAAVPLAPPSVEPAARIEAAGPAPSPSPTPPISAKRGPVPRPRGIVAPRAPGTDLAVAVPEPRTDSPAIAAPAAVTAPPAPEAALPDLPYAGMSFHGNGKRLTREGRNALDAVADLMHQHRDLKLVIQARTSPRRSAEKTDELGQKRALAVARYLEDLGIEPSRLRSVSLSVDEPEESNDRVEFVLDR